MVSQNAIGLIIGQNSIVDFCNSSALEEIIDSKMHFKNGLYIYFLRGQRIPWRISSLLLPLHFLEDILRILFVFVMYMLRCLLSRQRPDVNSVPTKGRLRADILGSSVIVLV